MGSQLGTVGAGHAEPVGLLSVACRPVLASEFMVEEHELRKEKIQEDYNDKYWDQRYTVVQRQIPSFLQKMVGKVLSTGEPRAPARHTLALRPVALSLGPSCRAGAPPCAARAAEPPQGLLVPGRCPV